jgi:hypothetical protein
LTHTCFLPGDIDGGGGEAGRTISSSMDAVEGNGL